MKQWHILNGDALLAQFPQTIPGAIIVCRECLIEGNVHSENPDEFYSNRAKFLAQTYGGTVQDYYDRVVSEFLKITEINKQSAINLWFEDDLFCQVNLWFVTDLLRKESKTAEVFLIRPSEHTYKGFGGLERSELVRLYENKQLLAEPEAISALWHAYKCGDTKMMLEIASKLQGIYPFMYTAVEAHVGRIPKNGALGRPKESLLAIMRDLKTKEFGPVFKEFSKRESIYGFGDLQVRRLYEQLLSNSKRQ